MSDYTDPEYLHFVLSHPEAVAGEMTQLYAKVKRLQLDAERYRWLRGNLGNVHVHFHDRIGWENPYESGEENEFDQRIDAALKEQSE